MGITAAIRLASRYHGDQLYGEYPYTYHLQEVSDKVIEIRRKGLFDSDMLDEDTLRVIAYLHDIVEDTNISRHELEVFGGCVVNAVLRLTKRRGVSYNAYINAILSDPYAKTVKIADTWANLNNSITIGHVSRIAKYSTQLNLLISDDT